jgi:hypothetical protein
MDNGKLNYGHFNNSSAVQQRTIMGTQGSSCPGPLSQCWCELCSRNGLWSNPFMNYSGDGPMGIDIVTNPSNAANNTAALETNMSTVAAFRTPPVTMNACKNAPGPADTMAPAAPLNLTIQ